MAYPRRCPLCGADYRRMIRSRMDGGIMSEFPHMTLQAEPGGTPDHRRPDEPGLLLTLRCLDCRGEYGWDYFADRLAGSRR